ncbi:MULTISPECIES: prephenate/arogenate dehydrogenase [Cyanophyceae]|uniref:prephenate/arogenate dehydrogenase n=1 Tax=Cyanophyceae TaxID=3028117 RepID=UPI0016879BF6|nr:MULTISPECIES: prephenate/arogenate dehydrogenase [Cyanophyceae]MBD1914900.1 prephenate/arogenate dehydrogenase [Phormidium sp. FACHB-77]MBD2028578.1 prephenate/arogenate dehydrogenase [Phormidium sp. FACHB-322]MBD2051778.1 prephenate/arogenate dehydrogenase [Leptolyngbya sp. FACHB-60]
MERIAIIGLGLIGGSLGLDLTRYGHPIVGIARRTATAEEALAMGAVTEAGTELALVSEADVVFICTPIDAVVDTAAAIAPYLSEGAVVTDVASVKGELVPSLEALWPGFVGGHPMAGKAEAGLAVAEAGLFRDRPYVLTPTTATNPEALERVRTIAASLGANLCQCHPDQHDRAVAWISHLPVMVSSSLILACQGEADSTILALAQTLASSGFQDTSRVGGGVPELGTLMARHNRTALLDALSQYQHQLERMKALISAENWDAVHNTLTQAQTARPAYLL